MQKRLLIVGIVTVLIISVGYIVWQTYDLSSEYNYATAKLDIKNGNVKIIHIGVPRISSKDTEIELVAGRYGFKNIYIEKLSSHQTENGIKNYNDLIDSYLILRNGSDWKINYKKEVDSLYKIADLLNSKWFISIVKRQINIIKIAH